MSIACRHFCTRTLLHGWAAAQAAIIVREHGRHPRWSGKERGRTETSRVREQAMVVNGQPASWRRIELVLDAPTESAETTIRLWSNLPAQVKPGGLPTCIAGVGASTACADGWKAC